MQQVESSCLCDLRMMMKRDLFAGLSWMEMIIQCSLWRKDYRTHIQRSILTSLNLHAAQQAAQDKRGFFTHPDEAQLLLLPWKFISGIVNMNSHVLNREHSIAVSVDKLTYACRKVNSTTDSVCCIKHMKVRKTLLTVKTSTIVGAGMGVFVKPNNKVENGNNI